jgi:hypothetical protein
MHTATSAIRHERNGPHLLRRLMDRGKELGPCHEVREDHATLPDLSGDDREGVELDQFEGAVPEEGERCLTVPNTCN